MSRNGKGSRRCPKEVTKEEFDKRWELTFKKKEKEKKEDDTKTNKPRRV